LENESTQPDPEQISPSDSNDAPWLEPLEPLQYDLTSPYDLSVGQLSGDLLAPPPPRTLPPKRRLLLLAGIGGGLFLLLVCFISGLLVMQNILKSTSNITRVSTTPTPLTASTYPPTSTTAPGQPSPTPYPTYTPYPGQIVPTATATLLPVVSPSATPQSTLTPTTIAVDDATIGSGNNRFLYQGNWINGTGYSTSQFFNGTVSHSRTSGDLVTIMFTGTDIQVYGPKEPDAGIVGFMIDDGPEIDVDQYHTNAVYQQLLFDSGIQSPGSHILTIVVTGQRNGASSDSSVWIDYAQITLRS
jgi:hypothetical protein